VSLKKHHLSEKAGIAKFNPALHPHGPGGKFAETPDAVKAPAAAKPAATKVGAAHEIQLLATSNPKKPGTKAHARFALYKGAKNVGEYLDKVEAAGFQRKEGLADLAWDAKHGFIVLHPPGGAIAAAPAAAKFDASKLKLQGPANVGGAHGGKQFYVDETGQKWLFKPAQASGQFIPHGEEAASNVGRAMDPEAIEVHAVTLGGQVGSVQKWAEGTQPVDFGNGMKHLFSSDFADLQHEHVVDWAISNHDAHPGQFVRLPSGKIVGIDKAQAFKHLGQDQLSTDFHPNAAFGEKEPVYNEMWRRVAKGELKVDTAETYKAVAKVQAIPDAEYAAWVRPYAEGRFKGDQQKADQFVATALQRKKNLKSDFDAFFAKNGIATAPAPAKIAAPKVQPKPTPTPKVPVPPAKSPQEKLNALPPVNAQGNPPLDATEGTHVLNPVPAEKAAWSAVGSYSSAFATDPKNVKSKVVALDQLTATKVALSKASLQTALGGGQTPEPQVVVKGGKQYLVGGQYKAAVEKLKGQTHVLAKVYDADAAGEQAIQQANAKQAQEKAAAAAVDQSPLHKDLTATVPKPTGDPVGTQTYEGSGYGSTHDTVDTKVEAIKKSGINFVGSTENSAIKWYTGSGFKEANAKLIAGEPLSAEQIDKVKKIDALLEKSFVKHDIVVYRGASSVFDKLKGAPPPEIFGQTSIISTSVNPSTAEGFGGQVIARITVPAGKRALAVGRSGTGSPDTPLDKRLQGMVNDEGEILLPRGSKFRIVKSQDETNSYGTKKHIVYMELL
jgi:hypothetical protein